MACARNPPVVGHRKLLAVIAIIAMLVAVLVPATLIPRQLGSLWLLANVLGRGSRCTSGLACAVNRVSVRFLVERGWVMFAVGAGVLGGGKK